MKQLNFFFTWIQITIVLLCNYNQTLIELLTQFDNNNNNNNNNNKYSQH